jgi:hypothetical protein
VSCPDRPRRQWSLQVSGAGWTISVIAILIVAAIAWRAFGER